MVPQKINLFWLHLVELKGPRLRSPGLITFMHNRSKSHIFQKKGKCDVKVSMYPFDPLRSQGITNHGFCLGSLEVHSKHPWLHPLTRTTGNGLWQNPKCCVFHPELPWKLPLINFSPCFTHILMLKKTTKKKNTTLFFFLFKRAKGRSFSSLFSYFPGPQSSHWTPERVPELPVA